MRKLITVLYTKDPATSFLTAVALSDHFNVSEIVTQAKDFAQLQIYVPDALSLAIPDSAERNNANVVYKELTPTEWDKEREKYWSSRQP